MILLNRSVSHRLINTENHQFIEAKWELHLELSDIPDPAMQYRFNVVEVTQCKYLSKKNPWGEGRITTSYKGCGTNTFSKSTKDKQKQQVISLIDKYLLDTNTPISYLYEKEENL